jgi:hypothetical protein
MEAIIWSALISINIILVMFFTIIKELWQSNKKKDEIIRLQDNLLKQNGIIERY